MAARPAPATAPVDVDRVLEARYLAAVVEELEAQRIPVDAAVLNGPGRPGGTVVFRDGGPTDPRPSCARWDGGRAWTLVSIGPAPRIGLRRRRLRRHRLPAPHEVAQFVADSASRRRPGWSLVLPWHATSGRRAARGR